MTVWLVERRGIYPQGIVGVFASEEAARACAEAATAAEKRPGEYFWDGDGHHDFVLQRAEMGAPPVDVARWTARYKQHPYRWEAPE